MSRTAEVLGVERSNLYRKMRAFGIAPARRPRRTKSAVVSERRASESELDAVASRASRICVREKSVAAADRCGRRAGERRRRHQPDDLALQHRTRRGARPRARPRRTPRDRRLLVSRSGSSTPGRCRGPPAAAQRLDERQAAARSRGSPRRSACATSSRSVARLTLKAMSGIARADDRWRRRSDAASAGRSPGAHSGSRHLRRQPLELAAPDVLEAAAAPGRAPPLRTDTPARRSARQPPRPTCRASATQSAIVASVERHERHDVDGAEARVLAAMRPEIDVRDRALDEREHRVCRARRRRRRA